MNNLVLTTKLYPPPPRTNSVVRPRLIERLNSGFQPGRRFILVSASAGFGKTTLVSKWIAELKMDSCFAWVSLDEADNDPTRFMFYLIAALQGIDPNIGANILPVLQSPQTPPWTELIVHLINQIAIQEKASILALDDYHLISSETVHQMVQLFIERQPALMRTVILTREDPPFPLPRMRARGQVTEIRERDLRFNGLEAQEFLHGTMGLNLSPGDVAKLETRTEGWVAGMQLAALALEDYTDEESQKAFVDAFTGSDRFIADYLVSEVLQRQPEPVRQFLLDTSILERFCPDLCDQITFGDAGSGKSKPILERLERGNMFLVPLDDRREWYRYHHLFAETLNHFARQISQDRLGDLHRQASKWFKEKGYIPEAIKHALASRDWDFTALLLTRYAMRMSWQGQGNLVIEWCRGLPKEYLKKAPAICIYYAWALVLTFRNDYLEAVEEKLQQAERALENSELPSQAQVGQDDTLVPLRDWVIGQICVIRSQILLGRYNTYIDPQELITLSLNGLELLPEVEKAIRGICTINLAHAQSMQNNAVEAQKAFEEILPYTLEAKNYLVAITSIFYQSRLAYYLGQMDRAEKLCRYWKEKFLEISGLSEKDIPTTRGLDIVLCLLMWERNQINQAKEAAARAIDLLGWASWMELHGFITLARLYHLTGDMDKVEHILDRMANLGPQHTSCAEALRISIEIQAAPADPQAKMRAEVWVNANTPSLRTPIPLGIGPYHCDAEYTCSLIWAQVQIYLGHLQEALVWLDLALDSAKSHHIIFRMVELMLTRALAFEALGEHRAALAEVEQALDAAEPGGYIRVFDQGPSLDRILVEVAENNFHTNYVNRLLLSFNRITGGEKSAGISNSAGVLYPSVQKEGGRETLIEPLSERELEVLKLIAEGFSNGQIAEQLYISHGTVKRHITNIYSKLAVQSRTQALAKARGIGLLV